MSQVVRLSDRGMADRVMRGAHLLDQHRPGWERQINLLRLGGLENDVLEQLYGSHEKAMEALGFGSIRDHMDSLVSGTPPLSFRQGPLPDYGFVAYRDDGGGDWRQAYQELRRLWRAEVRSRLRR
jgi:hypothetical protein